MVASDALRCAPADLERTSFPARTGGRPRLQPAPPRRSFRRCIVPLAHFDGNSRLSDMKIPRGVQKTVKGASKRGTPRFDRRRGVCGRGRDMMARTLRLLIFSAWTCQETPGRFAGQSLWLRLRQGGRGAMVLRRWRRRLQVSEGTGPGYSGGGTTPSCCIRRSMSPTVQCSVILPSMTVMMSMLSKATSLPVAGMPMNGPWCVPWKVL